MAEQTTLQALGLRTGGNELGGTPTGGLIRAYNCMLLAAGLMGSRRGQPRLSYGFGAAGNTANALAVFGSTAIAQYTDADDAGRLTRDTGSAFSDYSGTYEPPDADLLRMKFVEIARNLYFTSTKGVYRLDGATRTPTLSGGPRTWGIRLGDYVENTTGFLGAQESVAYRVVFGVKDTHGTIYLGPPSSRLVVTNPASLGSYATGTLTISGGTGSVGGTVNVTTVTVTWATSDAVTATALAAAMNASVIGNTFLCTVVYNVVTITALATGTAGNVVLTASGTGVTASGTGTLTGGAATGGACNVSLSITLADAVPATVFWQLYRSAVYPADSDGNPIEPNDELYLVNEAWFTGIGSGDTLLMQSGGTQITESGDTLVTQIADLDVLDDTPDLFALSNAPLYTNSSRGDGILQQNDAPPLCKDLTWWDNCAWYANIAHYQEQILAIIGVGVGADGSTGIRYSDQITFGDTTLTAGTTEDAQTGTYKLYLPTDATDSLNVSEAIGATVESLIYVLNQQAGTFAQGASGVDVGSDGRMLYQGIAYDDPEIEITVKAKVLSISSITGNGSVSNLQCYTPGTLQYAIHGLTPGDTVYIYSTTPPSGLPNGTYTVLGASQSASNFAVASTQSGTVITSGATTIQRVTPAANLAWRPQPPPVAFDVAVGGLDRQGDIVFVTCDVDHGLRPGTQINIQPVDVLDPKFPAGFKTVLGIDAAYPTVFTYTEAGSTAVSTTAYRSGSRVTTSASSRPAGLTRSKIQQQEAVPRINEFDIGVTDAEILRIIGLNQYLFVFKTDGIYYVVQDGLGYHWQLLDDTVHAVAPDTVCICDHRVFALTNKGVVAVTASDVKVISTPEQIAQELFQYYGTATFDTLKTYAWACARETDGLYILGVPALGGDAPFDVPRMYVYSTRAREWTTWEKEWISALVRKSDDALIFLAPSSDTAKPTLAFENNTKTALDYQDGTTTLAVTGIDGNEMTVTDASEVSVGDGISYRGSYWIVTAIAGSVLTLSCDTVGTTTINVAVGGAPLTTPVTVTDESPDDAAILLAADINGDAGAAFYVTASAVSSSCNLVARVGFPGTSGNAIAIAAVTDNVGVSAPTLAGGVDGVAAFKEGITVAVPAQASYGLTIAGFTTLVGYHTSLAQTATDLVNAINVNVDLTGIVTAAVLAGPGNQIRLDAVNTGTAGNSITVVAAGTPAAVTVASPGRLAGGIDNVQAGGYFSLASYLGDATAYGAFDVDLQWREQDGGAPADEKEWREIHLHHRRDDYREATLTYTTDRVAAEQTQVVYAHQTVEQAEAGTVPSYEVDTTIYPGKPVPAKKIRVALSQDFARASYLNVGFTIREAFAIWTLNGITTIYERVSSKGSRGAP